MEELAIRDEGLAIASNALIDIAEQAERRIEAIIKIKKVALKVTNKFDWTNQQDRPYLQVSGSEKIANLFNISWRIDEPRMEVEDNGHFTYTFKGEFSLVGRTIEVEGSRSSKDPFFKKHEWKEEGGKRVRVELPISAIDKRDVKMAALTNLLGNGISRILGIRNLQWTDLLEFAGIKKEEVTEIQYKKNGEKPVLREPQKKEAPAPVKTETGNPKIKTQIMDVSLKTGKKDGKTWGKYTITGLNQDGNEIAFGTFSETFGSIATKERGSGVYVEIEYVTGTYGNDIKNLQLVEERQPGDEG